MKTVDLVIIGGGSAGMASALKAYQYGVNDILILEKDGQLGGILNQCIHNGFGLTEFKEELTGPEYLTRFADQVRAKGIRYATDTLVSDISKDKVVTYTNREEGTVKIQAKAIIFATGCYERGAGAIQIPGDRVSGIITAGTAQKYLNIHGYLVGKRIVILGSGDIGLIMARRLTLEGAKVLCVSEIMPYSNGLNRNIAQCLLDYNIPLYLSHTVSKVIGKSRVEKVILSQVDDKLNIIPGTEMEFDCDTLILSVGLLPYISLPTKMGCKMGRRGLIVDENMQTSIPGVFACGNCLHVHDVVDFVTDEGRNAGYGAAIYLLGGEKAGEEGKLDVNAEAGILYVVPQQINKNPDAVTFKFRVSKPIQNVFVNIRSGDKLISRTFKPALIPSEMVMIKVEKDKLVNLTENLSVSLEERKI